MPRLIPKLATALRSAALLAPLLTLPLFSQDTPLHPGELAWSLGNDPATLDPAKVDERAAEMVRYLTGGVLVRLNRSSLSLEPALAESWTVSGDGKLVTFRLRPGLRFSDGSPLTSADVVATLHRVLAPATGAPVADEFLAPTKVSVEESDPLTVRVHLPQRIVSIGGAFDQIAIEPANHPSEGRVTAGPFSVAEFKQGQYVRLARNPYYWGHDASGTQLPYATSIRLDVINNRETAEMRFARGQYSFIEDVPADGFDALSRRVPGGVHDLGPSLNTEQMWFNQAPSSPLPAWEKAWFTNRAFRQAISGAIHRADLVRIAYAGHATPANGFVSPANGTWYNRTLPAATDNPVAVQALLAQAGFHKQGNALVDRDGHAVKFSILTNTGNRSRERMAALIQQDLAAFGNVVTLDFPALIERLMHTQDYEAALLGWSNIQPDPSSMMNAWLSSSPNHQWNPSQKTPATPWEAAMDREMLLQAGTGDFKVRKAAVDRVQAIVADQQPFIFLVYPNTLCAASPSLGNLKFTVLQPDVVSSIETIKLNAGGR